MILHFHYSCNPHSGEIRRIKNIDKIVSSILSDNKKNIEIEFYPLKSLKFICKNGKFKLSDNTRKFYIPRIPKIEMLDTLWTSFFIFIFCLIFKPQYVLGEYSSCSRSIQFLKKNKNRKILIDIHGALPEEYEYSAGEKANKKHSKRITNYEAKSIQKADYIICQSEEMKRHIIKKYQAISDKIVVYRCGIDTSLFNLQPDNRINLRKELNIAQDTVVFVYSGGLHKWQKVDETLKIFDRYNRYNHNSKFLVLTKDTEQLYQMLQKLDLMSLKDDIIIKSLASSQVPAYLNAADVAFLLRDNVVMNAVAFPTKLAEYLACGLPIISSDVSRYWLDENAESFIFCYNSDSNISQLGSFIATQDKQKISDYGISSLSLQHDNNTFRKFMEKQKE